MLTSNQKDMFNQDDSLPSHSIRKTTLWELGCKYCFCAKRTHSPKPQVLLQISQNPRNIYCGGGGGGGTSLGGGGGGTSPGGGGGGAEPDGGGGGGGGLPAEP